MAIHLFLASTPFNILTSAMVAFELPPEDEAYLGLIDQPETERSFVTAINQWQTSPFKQTLLLSQQAKGKGKRQKRNLAFERIKQFLDQVKPDHIYTGNDRRIEFQFSMHYATSLKNNTLGIYLDDGTYSYLGRKTHWFKDQFIDNLVKKFSYGFWWKQPSTIGASEWVSQTILAFPESAVPALKIKQSKPLPENLQRTEFKLLAQICLALFDFSAEKLAHIDAILLLPHESVATDQTKNKLSYWLINRGAKISFKHHPRTTLVQSSGDRKAWLIPDEALQIPSGIPMEVLLPLLQPTCRLAGDVSTALLTAKWLRPELEVTAFATANTSIQWLNLLNLLKIKVEPA